jgi:CDP-diacylglycerol pyrophosphatase
MRGPKLAISVVGALLAGLVSLCGAHPISAQTAADPAATCVLPPRPDTLWALAQCCERSLTGDVGCRVYDKKDDYVIIKDNSVRKPQSYLIIPTRRVTGIEDGAITQAPVVDFWQYGWAQSRTYPGYPPADTAMAINSARSRSQNQLHIHISCVRPAVRKALDQAEIGFFPAKPVTLRLPPHDHLYRAIKVTGLSGEQSPFLVFQADPAIKDNMADQSIAVVESSIAGQYVVLDTQVDGGNPGHAEELLDQTCQSATR